MNYLIKNKDKITFVVLALLAANGIFAQSKALNYNQLSGQQINSQSNVITTAVPFLMISPDSRAGGMGDAGAASSADAYSIHWNASKLAFADKKLAVGISYVPWLRALVPDINLAYLSGYYATKKNGTFGASLRYFSMGDITFTDINGNSLGQFRPNEFALDIAYARKLSKTFSIGGAARYVNSNLTGGGLYAGAVTHPGRTVAADISATYRSRKIKLGDKDGFVGVGMNISNIGAKISYSDNNTKNNANFIPINMRLGSSLMLNLDDYNTITFLADANKLLVPTPPVYARDSAGVIIPDPNGGGGKIAYGKDPTRGVASGMFGSFSDAPGGAKEELREINYSLGMEYWYNKLFAIRGGFFYESPYKGNRQYITLGSGVKYNVFGLDFSYLIPTKQRNPLENTLRFSLTFDFDAFKAQNDVIE